MIAAFLWKGLFRNQFTSALTGAAILFGALLSWHVLDKSSAVREAVNRFVAGAELAAAEAKANELQRIIDATREANRMLQKLSDHAAAQAVQRAQEIEAYETENQINPRGVVDRGLLDRMHSQ